MSWVDILDEDVDAGSPVTQSLMTALRDNPIAIANGDTGAPKIQLNALQPPSSGQSQIQSRLSFAATVIQGGNTSFASIGIRRDSQGTNILVGGSIRVQFETAIVGNQTTAEWRVLRNAVVVSSGTQTSTNWLQRNIDLAVNRGDWVQVQMRIQSGTSAAIWRLRNITISTGTTQLVCT